jgi:LuxR family maltose regulon positive regulatory protein
MGSDTHTPQTPALLRTKLYRPPLANDVIQRSHLLERLNRGFQRSATLVSAPAGFGKTTLLGQWLDQAPYQAAWLSLDEGDNHLVVFLRYFIAAIQTLFPEVCSTTHSLLAAPQTPALDYLTTTLINEMADLPETFLLVLDDYHFVNQVDVHQLVSALMQHGPPQLHLAIASRQDPPYSVIRLQASQQITEIRGDDLRFTPEEVKNYVKLCLGAEVSPETVAVLAERTEGWAVGLRLACLALREQDDTSGFLETFQGTDRYIMEYLVDEVLSRQPGPIQTFLLRTSILDRFCAPLCDAVLNEGPARKTKDGYWPFSVRPSSRSVVDGPSSRSEDILASLEQANLFVVPLDQHGEWYRYNHLFKELLTHKLRAETTEAQRTALHARAGTWLSQNGFVEEALQHFLAANDTAAAVDLVARQRYALMNQAQWQHLEQRFHNFSPDIIDQYPDLLMLKAWLLYHQGQWAALPAAVTRIEAALAQTSLAPETVDHLQGEISALRSLLYYHAVDPKSTLDHAQQALEKTPRELWIVRILARMYLAGALQMMGDLNGAYAAIYDGFEEEEAQSNQFKATLLNTVCNIHWIAADLGGMAQAAGQCIALSQNPFWPEFVGWGHYHLGRARYHQNDLAGAEGHFAAVVEQPYLNYGVCYVYSACGLALIYQVQGRPDQARAVAESAVALMLETGNTTLLPVAQAFQAEIALMQGQIATASQWAARLDPVPPLSPMFGLFAPHMTLVKVRLAQNTPASRGQAADLLIQLREYCESTYNTRFLIETLGLQVLLYHTQGEKLAALDTLERALTLAQPGGFIRLFVGLGPGIAHLLPGLRAEDSGMNQYIDQILAAFDQDKAQPSSAQPGIIPQPLIEPLTDRELDVLALLDQRLTDREIAQRLVISPHTVKTHTKSIFAKLSVNNRQQAAARARELGLLENREYEVGSRE